MAKVTCVTTVIVANKQILWTKFCCSFKQPQNLHTAKFLCVWYYASLQENEEIQLSCN